MEDKVNHPKHYTEHPSKVECIEITRHYNFTIGNAIKYLWRQGLKKEEGYDAIDKQIEDCKKAIWYITDHIKQLELSQISTKIVTEIYPETSDETQFAQNDGEIEETPNNYAVIRLVKSKESRTDCDECFAQNDSDLCLLKNNGDCKAETGYHFELIKNE